VIVKVWDVRFTDKSGVQQWLECGLTDEATARVVAEQIGAGLWGEEFGGPAVALDRLADLVSRYPVGSRVVWNRGTEWERLATVRGHNLYDHFPQPYEVLVLAPDGGRVTTVLANYVVLADEKGA